MTDKNFDNQSEPELEHLKRQVWIIIVIFIVIVLGENGSKLINMGLISPSCVMFH